MVEKRRRTWWIVGIAVALVASCVLTSVGLAWLAAGGAEGWFEEPHVAEVRVRGPIVLRGSAGVLTSETASAERIVAQLERARRNPRSKAVLLRVD
ncbi:MAG: signal peptide peptidase SppA, partial [Thermomicrobium sp.]|nr:signal peptide peptidase SppA [Thermomicrobium sp.]